MADQELLEKVKQHVITEFGKKSAPGIFFHNLSHTISVVKAVKKIAVHSKLQKKEIVLVEIAAWFQDIELIENVRESKQDSAGYAQGFLENEKIPETTINRVTDLIKAIRPHHQPIDELEKVLADADFFYFSKKSFQAKNELLRKEKEFLSGVEINDETWLHDTINLMKSHRYFTEYCRSELNPKKEVNLLKLTTKLASLSSSTTSPIEATGKKLPKEHSKIEFGSDKGIETLFRIASSNNQRLFTLADNKAHILITVNSIIMSIIISILIRKLAENPFLIWPTFILLFTSFLSTVFSILATRPKIDGGTFTVAALEAKKVNLIYFGNFHRMTVDEYIQGMEAVMADRIFLYQTLIRDAYWHGSVLGRKYRFLRKAYNVFLFGLGISIAAFVIAYLFHLPVSVIKNLTPGR